MSTEIICTLTGDEFRRREQDVISRLMPLVTETVETGAGYRFRFAFSEETLESVFEFIRLERECCRFFDFRLDVSAEKDIMLELSGPKGTKQFIAATFK